jgi:hypothetical protein
MPPERFTVSQWFWRSVTVYSGPETDMAQDLTVRASAPVTPLPASERGRAPEPPTSPPLPMVAAPNPRLRIDGELGMIVIEFRDSAGEVAQSYPNPKEIEAYRVQAMAVSSGDLAAPGQLRPAPANHDTPTPRAV